MPFYAVAVGKRVGIYDTYNECFEQINGFPGAKFKKFSLRQEAEKFISDHSKGAWNSSENANAPPQRPENVNPSVSYPVEKVSPSNSLLNNLNNRVAKLEEKLDTFITSTNKLLENVVNRLKVVEKKLCGSNEVGFGIPKIKHEKKDIEAEVSDFKESAELKLNEEDLSEFCGAAFEDEVSPGVSQPKRLKLDLGEHNFIKNENGFVVVYTDGACTNNGKMQARAGIGVWFNHNHPLNVSAPVIGPPTNNNAEIQAARIAIKQAVKANVKKLLLNTDSKFLINCITQWIHKWKKNDWKLSSGGNVKNKDELVKLDSAIQEIEVVVWNYVAGHRGIEGNEMADRLARKGAEGYKCNVTYSNNVDHFELFNL